MCSATTNNILPEPPEELKCVSAELTALIRAKIAADGSVSFSDYMEMALYEPGLGYYSAGLQKFGEGGDFVTAPQLGNVFARCLAKQIEQVGAALGPYEIIEAGAGTGQLAADILQALPQNQAPLRYRILERSAHLRQVQKETLAKTVPEWMDRVDWLEQPPDAGWQGIFLANEVLDALTVERFCVEPDGVSQMQVAYGDDGFKWVKGDCPKKIQRHIEMTLSSLQQQPAEGYYSEINTNLSGWLEAVTASMQKGLAILVDYGYTRHEYYRPERRTGTLICHYQHRAHDDPFHWPGLTDISTSVDFTAVAEAADICALDVCGYTTQAMFLMASGLNEVLAELVTLPEQERLTMNNHVRRLTLPGEMGERFQVMALGRGLEEDLCDELLGFALNDLCHRL